MFPISDQDFLKTVEGQGIMDLSSATIRQICSLAAALEDVSGEKMIHLEIGNPGLPAEEIGVAAEVAALESGVANKYPPIQGIPELKQAGSRFLKSFLDVDIPAKYIIPTVGSMQGCFTLQLLLAKRLKEKDSILFINPGFPANRHQAKVLGINDVALISMSTEATNSRPNSRVSSPKVISRRSSTATPTTPPGPTSQSRNSK